MKIQTIIQRGCDYYVMTIDYRSGVHTFRWIDGMGYHFHSKPTKDKK